MNYSFQLGPIRPPSEAFSLLIRATINCPWNRCKFCHNYKDSKFQLRSVEDIKQDIKTASAIQDEIKEFAHQSGDGEDLKQTALAIINSPPNAAFHNVALWLYAGGKTAFLQDANSLIMRTGELVDVIRYLKETFPSIQRITSYARSKTAAKKSHEELKELEQAGLSRLHIGLESGYDPLLEFMNKGTTATDHIAGGRKIVESGISLCEYVVLGLGGKEMQKQHAIQTARVLNEIDPDFIRIRTLVVNKEMPLHKEVEDGNFIRATDDEIIEEEKLLIENLDCHSNFVSDHITNLLQEIEGKLPEDKDRMLACIEHYKSLSPDERLNFRVGRRTGIYNSLDSLNDHRRREVVEQIISGLHKGNEEITEKTIYNLMEDFI